MGCLKLRNIRFSRGKNVVLDIPSMDFDSGSDTILTGPSGSGKSTLVQLLCGFLAPSSGSYCLDGEELAGLSEREWDRLRGRRIGLVLQDSPLLRGFSLLDNILIAMGIHGKTDRPLAQKLLSQVGLGDRFNFYPTQLSSGQKQRACLVRALINQPDIVLADEPTAHLDPEQGAQSVSLLREMSLERGATLIMTSHDPGHISLFSNHVAISNTKLNSNPLTS